MALLLQMLQEQLRVAGVASGVAHQGFTSTSTFPDGFQQPAGVPRWQYDWSNPADEVRASMPQLTSQRQHVDA